MEKISVRSNLVLTELGESQKEVGASCQSEIGYDLYKDFQRKKFDSV